MNERLEPEIQFASASDVRPLRREVLRVGMPDATVEFDGDDDPDTFHLVAIEYSGEIIAVSTWMVRALVDEPERRSIQLRGMATSVRLQGHGLGGRLVAHGVREARTRNIDWIWANARDSALGFYQRHGFHIIGGGFIESVTGLPHHRVRLDLRDSP